jgi:hypothetical protein
MFGGKIVKSVRYLPMKSKQTPRFAIDPRKLLCNVTQQLSSTRI